MDIAKIDQQRSYLVMHLIKQIKEDAYILAPEGYRHKGFRFSDNKRLLNKVLVRIRDTYQLNNIEEINQKFLSLNQSEIVPYIQLAVIDAVQADYYYTFEKEW